MEKVFHINNYIWSKDWTRKSTPMVKIVEDSVLWVLKKKSKKGWGGVRVTSLDFIHTFISVILYMLWFIFSMILILNRTNLMAMRPTITILAIVFWMTYVHWSKTVQRTSVTWEFCPLTTDHASSAIRCWGNIFLCVWGVIFALTFYHGNCIDLKTKKIVWIFSKTKS